MRWMMSAEISPRGYIENKIFEVGELILVFYNSLWYLLPEALNLLSKLFFCAWMNLDWSIQAIFYCERGNYFEIRADPLIF